MQQLINRLLNSIVGFLLGAFKSTNANKPLPKPPPFPVGTPPTPTPTPVPTPIVTAPPVTNVQQALRWEPQLSAFIHRWIGQFVPPKFGGAFQCVALVNEWTSEAWHVFWPRLSDAGSFVGYNVPGFALIRNTPNNYPYPGDIVEWGHSPNLPFGHIGVCVGATVMTLDTFDQNWPFNSPAHVQRHTYAGVSGWHRKL